MNAQNDTAPESIDQTPNTPAMVYEAKASIRKAIASELAKCVRVDDELLGAKLALIHAQNVYKESMRKTIEKFLDL